MPNPQRPDDAPTSDPKADDEPERLPTPYAEALTKRTRIDYDTSNDDHSAVDEIKLSRAMTISALRARKYREARAWQQTLSTALRIQAKGEDAESNRSGLMGVITTAADDRRIELAAAHEPAASPIPFEDGGYHETDGTNAAAPAPHATPTNKTEKETN